MKTLVTIPAILLIAATMAGVWLARRAPSQPGPEPGIPATLADDRRERVSELSYDLALMVPEQATAPVTGTVTASFVLHRPFDGLAFDFAQPADRMRSTHVNGTTAEVTVVDGHIALPGALLREGRNTVTFEFTAGDAALNRQADFFYSLFVPARASHTLPCLDQPSLKARWTIALDMPHTWVALSNGREVSSSIEGTRARVRFEETPPLPSYLVAILAGRFQIDTVQARGRSVRVFHRETDRDRLTRNLADIATLHAQALDWLEDYTTIAYPFGKFDVALIPAFQFSGMEHPGAVYYNANTLLLDASATQAQHLARANVIAHETAHMWFGDLVTMPWFDDVWMKEVFANFLAAKIVNPSFPAMNHDLRFLVQHYPAAYEIDRTPGANPIRQRLDNLAEAGSLYGAIIYQKAPIVVRQLERLVGEEVLRNGLREYLRLYGFANASWPDLLRILDARTPHDLEAWSRAWITLEGRPTIEVSLDERDGRIGELRLTQADTRKRDVTWAQQIDLALESGGTIRHIDVTLTERDTVVAEAKDAPAPKWMLPTGGGLGYGHFVLSPSLWSGLATHAARLPDDLTRGAAYVLLWEGWLEGHLPRATMQATLLEALSTERNELNLQLVLDHTRALFWRFTPEGDRLALSTTLEPMLRQGLERAGTAGEKAAWFTTLRQVALTPSTLTWLETIWARHARIEGLPLAEVDEIDLTFDLAIRGAANADAIVAAQVARTSNPDRRARLEFIAPALSADRARRAAFFDQLSDPKARSREAWVLDGIRALHHPLRAAESAVFVERALELVLDIQRTGDIFFPKRWADTTLAGYRSAQVADTVRRFIDTLPADYPARLRWVVQASADPLFRAVRIAEAEATPRR